jgi:hypothetical protein
VSRLLLMMLAATVLFAAGCGGEDDGGSAPGGGEAEQAEQDRSGGDSGEDSPGDSGGGSSDEDAVRQTMLDYADAIATGDAAAACETLSDKAKQELAQVYEGSDDCETTFGRFLPSLPEEEAEKARNLEASDLEVKLTGDTATVTGPGFERPAPMVEVDGDWKIASFTSR